MLHADEKLWREVTFALRSLYVPSKKARAQVMLLPTGDPQNPIKMARTWFAHLTLNSENPRLGRCPQCGVYFVRKTRRESTYCSQRCGSRASSAVRTPVDRAEQRQEKLNIAAAGIAKYEVLWRKGRVQIGWKEWVACHYNVAAEITLNFLTRAEKKGELIPPRL
jgi:hypothetical protein